MHKKKQLWGVDTNAHMHTPTKRFFPKGLGNIWRLHVSDEQIVSVMEAEEGGMLTFVRMCVCVRPRQRKTQPKSRLTEKMTK